MLAALRGSCVQGYSTIACKRTAESEFSIGEKTFAGWATGSVARGIATKKAAAPGEARQLV